MDWREIGRIFILFFFFLSFSLARGGSSRGRKSLHDGDMVLESPSCDLAVAGGRGGAETALSYNFQRTCLSSGIHFPPVSWLNGGLDLQSLIFSTDASY